jgi:sec-independent protein translocase protein TatB
VFNLGPWHLLVLAIVGLIVLGPERLPGLARDAARLVRSLREMATGAREQLREELGPEFADLDLRDLNPRTAVAKAVFGEDPPDLSKYDPRRVKPGAVMRDALFGEDDAKSDAKSDAKPAQTPAPAAAARPAPAARPAAAAPRPRPRPVQPAPPASRTTRFDDAT